MAGEQELSPADYVTLLLSSVTLAEIETSRKQGSVATLRALADALDVRMDDIAK